ncbi:PREDICTED: uncharacterized protein LOC108448454 [Corvus brachyrhynchos]|uniref:uncharacterized protein LOC108448454 n=1 Tax=Corvus brachyrhynchos TaxID=85066 RepID=UPI0008167944|nr:PREDICTED: uncharacterized protein LOC108448454 [Corvus brachyrhynchos]
MCRETGKCLRSDSGTSWVRVAVSPQAGNGWRGWKGMGELPPPSGHCRGSAHPPCTGSGVLDVPTLFRTLGAGCAPLSQDRGCWMCPPYSGLWVLHVPTLFRIVGAGCAPLSQDCGCWMCPPFTGSGVLDVPSLFRTVGAACAHLIQDCGCWMCSPFTGLWVLHVPSLFRIVGAACALLVQDCGCCMCPPCSGLWVLHVPSLFRIVGAACALLVQDCGCWMCSPFTGLWVLHVLFLFRIVGAGFVTLVQDYGCSKCLSMHGILGAGCAPLPQDCGCWICLLCTGLWVLDVPPSFRILGAGCAPFIQNCGCWLCPPRSGSWVLAVLPCRVLQVPSATHSALWWVLSATHPWVLAVLPAQHPGCWMCSRQGGGCGYHPPGTASAGGAGWPPRRGLWVLWNTPRVIGRSMPTSASALGIPGHPWVPAAAVPGRERCLPGKTKKIPVQHHPLSRGFHLHQPWGSPGAHHGCSSQFLDTVGWAPGLSGAGELSPPGDSSTPEPEAGAWHRSQIPNVAPQGSTGLALKPPEAGLGCLRPAGNPDLVLCILLRALTTVLPGTSRAPGLILAPANCCTSSGAESQPGCIRGAPARGNASIPVGSGAGGQLWPSIPPAAPALLLPEPQPFGN